MKIYQNGPVFHTLVVNNQHAVQIISANMKSDDITCLQRSSRNSEYAIGLMSLNLAMNECLIISITISHT